MKFLASIVIFTILAYTAIALFGEGTILYGLSICALWAALAYWCTMDEGEPS